jgi:CBS domain-containing protein
MTKARELMTPDPVMVSGSESVQDAAVRMAETGLGALPICGEGGTLTGMITDRDIVVKVLAAGKDPRAVHVNEVTQGEAVTIGADDEVDELFNTMVEHGVRRVPVVDGTRVVGIIAQADIARQMSQPDVGLLVEAISTP